MTRRCAECGELFEVRHRTDCYCDACIERHWQDLMEAVALQESMQLNAKPKVDESSLLDNSAV